MRRGRSPAGQTGQTPSSMGTASRMASPPATPAEISREVRVDETSLEPSYDTSQQIQGGEALQLGRSEASTGQGPRGQGPSNSENAQHFNLNEAWEAAQQQEEISVNETRERNRTMRSLDQNDGDNMQIHKQRSLDRDNDETATSLRQTISGSPGPGSLDPDASRRGSLDPTSDPRGGQSSWNALEALRSSLRSVGLGTRSDEQNLAVAGRAQQGPEERMSPLPLAGACVGTGPLAVRETPQTQGALAAQDLAQVGSSGLGVRGVEGLLYRDPMSHSGQSRHSGSELAQLVEGMSQMQGLLQGVHARLQSLEEARSVGSGGSRNTYSLGRVDMEALRAHFGALEMDPSAPRNPPVAPGLDGKELATPEHPVEAYPIPLHDRTSQASSPIATRPVEQHFIGSPDSFGSQPHAPLTSTFQRPLMHLWEIDAGVGLRSRESASDGSLDLWGQSRGDKGIGKGNPEPRSPAPLQAPINSSLQGQVGPSIPPDPVPTVAQRTAPAQELTVWIGDVEYEVGFEGGRATVKGRVDRGLDFGCSRPAYRPPSPPPRPPQTTPPPSPPAHVPFVHQEMTASSSQQAFVPGASVPVLSMYPRPLMESMPDMRAHDDARAYAPDRSREIMLPTLEITPEEGPLAVGDWLTLIAPLISDLAPAASTWWGLVAAEADRRYKVWLQSPPLERAALKGALPENLQEPRYMRLEQRTVSMLIKALPKDLSEELISQGDLTTVGVLFRVLIKGQPGGAKERQLILSYLHNPGVASSPSDANLKLRRWSRWASRGRQLGISMPDPSLLLKGIDSLMAGVLKSYTQASFRLSFVRVQSSLDHAHAGVSPFVLEACSGRSGASRVWVGVRSQEATRSKGH